MEYNLPGFFHIARAARQQSNHKKPMGAYIRFKNNGYWGWNEQKTHPKYVDGKTVYSIHAEIMALIHSKYNIDGAKIYIYREVKGKPAMAKPCKYCMKYLIEVGIRCVYFTVPYYPYYEKMEL